MTRKAPFRSLSFSPTTALAGLVGGLALTLGGCAAEMDLDYEAHSSAIETEFISTQWGYVWSHKSTGSFVAASAYSRNSSGNVFGQGVDNTVTQLGVGEYSVHFPGLSSVGGHVQVSAYGSGSERCKVASWVGASGGTDVRVNCFSATGAAVNSLFTASFVNKSGTSSTDEAYVWANQPASASYTPSAAYQFNSSGQTNTITRQGTGAYTVSLPGQSAAGGTLEVTAYGAGSDYCKVTSWQQTTDGVDAFVRCFAAGGSPSDSLYTLNFANASSPNGAYSYSYAWADQATSASYTPSLSYQKGFLAGSPGDVATDITAGRSAQGRYFVDMPGMGTDGSNLQVTAYGTGSEYCKVVNWTAISGGGVRGNIACFDTDGDPADTRFVTVFTDEDVFIP
ncbi:hypothetical protein [Haliangium ochraceum]|uniref:Lipoprotein n=1 Tax=Haliangium ochraceum (strain DSM 14365 / JCM 11303 / SMP-2) TaxID=502025 RepID=D0LS96_HALO1|nr:hypothetical protein [Haliangium ochraceum]ACY15595.1 conserved hypothetical protein [Haliangium ochraceum DSM 14365]